MNLKELSRLVSICDAGGQAAGKMELATTSVDAARKYAEERFKSYDRDLEEEIPDFDDNYVAAQDALPSQEKQRKDMPVIEPSQAKTLQKALAGGYLGVVEPFDETFEDNPFPRGLDPESDLAKEWLNSGLPKYDGAEPGDDVVDCDFEYIEAYKLLPVQKQIYFDKSIENIAKYGVKSQKEFLTSEKNCFVVSKDNKIVDGHHRWLAAQLVDPTIKVQVLKIDMGIKELLELCCTFGDVLGNEPNK